MTRLTEESIEFARRHIERYYDTDFFPKHFAFEAVWHNWDEVKAYLISKNILEIPVSNPLALAWPKPKGTYRVVHQLDPLSSLVYTAIAYQVGASIEVSREAVDERIACSYRIQISDGSFFVSGTGYSDYRFRTEELCRNYSHILVTDITDFYNQIYVHRVRNAISTSGVDLDKIAEDAEKLLMRWNSENSQGIPVGPAASIVMSEAVLIDVDRFIKNLGVLHTRYVDDFRIFGSSHRELQSVLRRLAYYLYDVHRLNLSGSKTEIDHSDLFLKETLRNPYELEKIDIFEEMEDVADPYGQEGERVSVEEASRADALKKLSEILSKVLAKPTVDLALARAVVRKAKALSLHEMSTRILNNSERLLPVINDVFLYLEEVLLFRSVEEHRIILEKLCEQDVGDESAFRVWCEWFVLNSKRFVRSPIIKGYVLRGENPFSRAKIAMLEDDIAWVRQQKSSYWQQAPQNRLSTVYASAILAKDERQSWLRGILKQKGGLTDLERWFAMTALNDGFDLSFLDETFTFDDEIPF